MRIAVVSDIHANLTALEAVIADIREVGVDLVVQGGDVVAVGARSAEVIDRIRELNWPGVYGNAEEMLWRPERLSERLQAPHLHRMRDLVLAHTIPATLAAIGEERLQWLRALPLRWSAEDLTVVHAVLEDAWSIVLPSASDEELERVYGAAGTTRVVYGHIHQAFVRRLPSLTVANSGAVCTPYDGDPRAAYAVVDGDAIAIRRVAYDVEREVQLLLGSDDPFAESTIATLRTGKYVPLGAQ